MFCRTCSIWLEKMGRIIMVAKRYAVCFVILLFSIVFAIFFCNIQVTKNVSEPRSKQPKVVVLNEGVDLELMPIQAGSFYMGTTNALFDNETPLRWLTLSEPFWMGRTEVTIGQFAEYIKSKGEQDGVHFENPYCPLDEKGNLYSETIFGTYWEQPMICVDWYVCVNFCKWLTERVQLSNKLPYGYELRLPTEVEWEYCCRAGSSGDYSGDLNSLAWFKDNSDDKTHRVGKKKPNDWGLYDMHGNVSEWCFDSFWDSLSWCDNDPAKAGRGPLRVFRGGSWTSPDVLCRSAFRGYYSPRFTYYNLGFRVILAPKIVESEKNIKGWEDARRGQKIVIDGLFDLGSNGLGSKKSTVNGKGE